MSTFQTDIDTFKDDCLDTNIGENTIVFLLEIPEFNNANKNEAYYLSQVESIPNSKTSPYNEIVPIKLEKLDFRDYKSWVKCISYIKSRFPTAYYYLFSLGHSNGLWISRNQGKKLNSNNTPNITFKENSKTYFHSINNIPSIIYSSEIIEKSDNKIDYLFKANSHCKIYDVLWNYELSNALNKIKKINFELIVLSNCSSSLFDNCFLYSKRAKRIIATETIICYENNSLDEILKVFNAYSNEPDKIIREIFKVYKKIAPQVLKNNKPRMDELTLFLIDIRRFEHLVKLLNACTTEIAKKHLSHPDWLFNIRSKSPELPNNESYIDLCVLLNTIKKNIIKNSKLTFIINRILYLLNSSITDKWISCRIPGNKNDLPTGISIYFPKISTNSIDFFKCDYILDKNKNLFLKKSNWDDFLKKLFDLKKLMTYIVVSNKICH